MSLLRLVATTPAKAEVPLIDLIGAIYQCTIEPEKWPQTLEVLCDSIGAVNASLAVFDFSTSSLELGVNARVDPAAQQVYFQRFAHLCPFRTAAACLDEGQVVSTGDVIDLEEYRSGRFYREWAEPQGVPETLGGILSRSGGALGFIVFNLPVPATRTQKQLLNDLLPHLQRAVAISQILKERETRAARFAATFGLMAAGIVFVGRNFEIVEANPAAIRFLGKRGARLNEPAFWLGDSNATGNLIAAINACAANALDDLRIPPILCRDENSGEIAMVVHVMPMSFIEERPDAVAAIFLADYKAPLSSPVEAMRRDFDLTPSEYRVLAALVAGQTAKDIAQAQGVALPTIRTHIQRLYTKTQTKGQAALVKLAMSMKAP